MMTTHNTIDIHEAAREGNLGEVKAFIKAGGIIDKRDADRWTPLMVSMREGHLEVARQLLRSGAALEAKDGDKWTAMHIAAANGHPHCCQLLLDRGANPRAVDENRRTPLHWSARYGYASVVETLLKRGAEPNFKDAEGKTANEVIGNDLSEDAREMVHMLLREHSEKTKTSRHRLGSCPVISPTTAPATVNVIASASSVAAIAHPSSPPSSCENNRSSLPLPSVGAAPSCTCDLSSGEQRVAGTGSHRRTSFSAAAHIRDHSSTGKHQAGSSSIAPPATATVTTSASSSVPSLVTPETNSKSLLVPTRGKQAQKLPPQASGSNGSVDNSEDVAATVAESSIAEPPRKGEDHGRNGRSDTRDDEISALRNALRAAEERARVSDQSLSEMEEERARAQRRAALLEERVTELEKALSQQQRHHEST